MEWVAVGAAPGALMAKAKPASAAGAAEVRRDGPDFLQTVDVLLKRRRSRVLALAGADWEAAIRAAPLELEAAEQAGSGSGGSRTSRRTGRFGPAGVLLPRGGRLDRRKR